MKRKQSSSETTTTTTTTKTEAETTATSKGVLDMNGTSSEAQSSVELSIIHDKVAVN